MNAEGGHSRSFLQLQPGIWDRESCLETNYEAPGLRFDTPQLRQLRSNVIPKGGTIQHSENVVEHDDGNLHVEKPQVPLGDGHLVTAVVVVPQHSTLALHFWAPVHLQHEPSLACKPVNTGGCPKPSATRVWTCSGQESMSRARLPRDPSDSKFQTAGSTSTGGFAHRTFEATCDLRGTNLWDLVALLRLHLSHLPCRPCRRVGFEFSCPPGNSRLAQRYSTTKHSTEPQCNKPRRAQPQ